MSAYSPEERARIMAEARALLDEDTGAVNRDDRVHAAEDPPPSWPVRTTAIDGARSCARADRLIAEAKETERMLERGRQERKREEQRIIRARQAATFRSELDARTDAITEAVAGFVAGSIDKVRSELRDEMQSAIAGLRVELAARQDRSDKVLDLPALPLRRRSDAA